MTTVIDYDSNGCFQMRSDAVIYGWMRLNAVGCGWMIKWYTIAVLCGCGTLRMRSNVDAVEFDYNVINRLRWLECGYGRIGFYLKRLKAIDRITLNADVCG